jgi:DNA modification methylase
MLCKILNYDCFEVLPKLKSNSVDLVLTDPPYCINYKDWDKEDFTQFTEKWVKEITRILKPTGTLWSFMGYQNICEFFGILEKQFGQDQKPEVQVNT